MKGLFDEFSFDARRAVEQEEDEGNWIVAYADLITLLFIFFVLLLSFSMVDESRFSYVVDKIKGETSSLSKMQRELENQFNKDQTAIKATAQGTLIALGPILFNNGSAKMNKKGEEELYKLYTLYQKHAAGKKMIIWGHAQKNELLKMNSHKSWEIGVKRALAVIRYFEFLGMESTLLELKATNYASLVNGGKSKIDILIK